MNCIHLGTSDYPQLLAEISGPPTCIWTRGDRAAFAAIGVAVIGARAASQEGLTAAYEIAFDLARAGIVVISGLARGVDSSAHQGALDGGGKTIAVLGTGIDLVYPAENTGLSRHITESGLLVTEFPPGSHPEDWHFPRRNRIISGLSKAVVVVEAREKSGSLITARLAADQGRDVMAVPGTFVGGRNRGANALLRDGAKLVESAVDLFPANAIILYSYHQLTICILRKINQQVSFFVFVQQAMPYCIFNIGLNKHGGNFSCFSVYTLIYFYFIIKFIVEPEALHFYVQFQ